MLPLSQLSQQRQLFQSFLRLEETLWVLVSYRALKRQVVMQPASPQDYPECTPKDSICCVNCNLKQGPLAYCSIQPIPHLRFSRAKQRRQQVKWASNFGQ